MRASEFILDEGNASRRKQASMNAKRRNANAQRSNLAPTTSAPTAPTNMQSASNATTTMAAGNGSYQVPGRVIPPSPYTASTQAQTTPTQTTPSTSSQAQTTPTQTTPTQTTPTTASQTQTGPTAAKYSWFKNPAQSMVQRRAIQIFSKKFINQIKHNEMIAQTHGKPFDLGGFVDGYLVTNKWNDGAYQKELQQAVASKSYDKVAKVMATIGQANTQAYSFNGSKETVGSSTAHDPLSMDQQARLAYNRGTASPIVP